MKKAIVGLWWVALGIGVMAWSVWAYVAYAMLSWIVWTLLESRIDGTDIRFQEPLDYFVEKMVEKLRENTSKGSWQYLSLKELYGLLNEEVHELQQELQCISFHDQDWCERVALESADIANFAMMIADNARREVE